MNWLPWPPICRLSCIASVVTGLLSMVTCARIARRVFTKDERTVWAYVCGQFGGGSWAIELPDGNATLLTYSDLRLLLGLEGYASERISANAEVGYVFARSISAFDQLQFVPSNTVMLRAGLSF